MARHQRAGVTAGLLLVAGGLTLAVTGSSLFHATTPPGSYLSPRAIAAEGHAGAHHGGSGTPSPAATTHRAERPTPTRTTRHTAGGQAGGARPTDEAEPPAGIGRKSASPADPASKSRARSGSGTPRSGRNPRAPQGSPSHLSVRSTSGTTQVDTSLRPAYLDQQDFLVPAPGAAGWYAQAGWPKPGYPGTSILVGHISWSHQPDVFWNLPRVRAGDTATVTYTSGQKVRFRVTRSAPERKTAVPHDDSIWDADNPKPLLRLITCDPSTTFVNHHYLGNWVVWAVPA